MWSEECHTTWENTVTVASPLLPPPQPTVAYRHLGSLHFGPKTGLIDSSCCLPPRRTGTAFCSATVDYHFQISQALFYFHDLFKVAKLECLQCCTPAYYATDLFSSPIERKQKYWSVFYLYNWCDKLFQKGKSQQWWPVGVNEVNKKALDVWTVLILISHNHQFAVTQRLQILNAVVFLVVLQTKNLDNAVDLSIFKDLKCKFYEKRGKNSLLLQNNNLYLIAFNCSSENKNVLGKLVGVKNK